MGWSSQDSFSKTFGENVTLGADFLTVVVDTVFDIIKPFGMLRAALVITNSTATMIRDGISRLIEPHDVSKLASKTNRPLIVDCEDILFRAWATSRAMIKSSTLSAERVDAAFGKLAVRLMLHLTKKEKAGYEGVKYTSLKDIEKKFISDMDPEAVPTAVEAAPAAGAIEQKVKNVMTSIEDADDPVRHLAERGFVINTLYHDAGNKDNADIIFKLEEISDDGTCKFVQQNFGLHAGAKEVSVDFMNVIKHWKNNMKKIPLKLRIDIPQMHGPNAAWVLLELERVRAFMMLRGFAADECDAEHDGVEYWVNPPCARAKVLIKKGELKLAPWTDSINKIQVLSKDPIPGQTTFKLKEAGDLGKLTFSITAPSKMTADEKDDRIWGKQATFSAYWWVVETTEIADVNMELKVVNYNGYLIPFLQNTKPIKPLEKLLIKSTKRASVQPGDGHLAGFPAKKLKKA